MSKRRDLMPRVVPVMANRFLCVEEGINPSICERMYR